VNLLYLDGMLFTGTDALRGRFLPATDPSPLAISLRCPAVAEGAGAGHRG
jgi:hypothetical protein